MIRIVLKILESLFGLVIALVISPFIVIITLAELFGSAICEPWEHEQINHR